MVYEFSSCGFKQVSGKVWKRACRRGSSETVLITDVTGNIGGLVLSMPHSRLHIHCLNSLIACAELIEQLIDRSGLDRTILRPGMFALNALCCWAPQIRARDVVRWPYLEVPTAPIDERDIAAVAVRTLYEDTHSKADYVLTGPQSLSHYQQIATIGSVLAAGQPAFITSTVAELTGVPAKPFIRWASDHAAHF